MAKHAAEPVPVGTLVTLHWACGCRESVYWPPARPLTHNLRTHITTDGSRTGW